LKIERIDYTIEMIILRTIVSIDYTIVSIDYTIVSIDYTIVSIDYTIVSIILQTMAPRLSA